MKKLELSRGKEALLDDEDYIIAKRYKWYAHYRRGKFYAATQLYDPATKTQSLVSLHDVILWKPKGFIIDHINGDSLDNRRKNLRVCTYSENCQNTKIRKDNTSGVRGVNRKQGTEQWVARVSFKKKRFYLGTFDKKKDAIEAYNKKASELYGINAKLN